MTRKKELELLNLSKKTILKTWNVLTQECLKKADKVKMADELVDVYEMLDSWLHKKGGSK